MPSTSEKTNYDEHVDLHVIRKHDLFAYPEKMLELSYATKQWNRAGTGAIQFNMAENEAGARQNENSSSI
jgi:hypothetical protein